jgi:hypothetical protein
MKPRGSSITSAVSSTWSARSTIAGECGVKRSRVCGASSATSSAMVSPRMATT